MLWRGRRIPPNCTTVADPEAGGGDHSTMNCNGREPLYTNLAMPQLYTLAYPTLTETDLTFIDNFHNRHDLRYKDVVAPHFTMVFACNNVAEDTYLHHVEEVAGTSRVIEFSCRYAMLGADDKDETAYVFLVPDEGYSAISRLHDRLYSGVLAPHLRLDSPYIPHITIGSLDDRHEAKRLCDRLNDRGIAIDGSLRALTVGVLKNGKIRDLASFELNAAT
jgi:2'-5' RNA ligase